MAKTRLFISFDYDNDSDLRILLAGQALHPDSPFEFADASVKEPLAGNWKDKVRGRIRRSDQLAVICGQFTHRAAGVAAEVEIARDESKPYFLLWGRNGKQVYKPATALPTDIIYGWTWPNLKALVGGSR